MKLTIVGNFPLLWLLNVSACCRMDRELTHSLIDQVTLAWSLDVKVQKAQSTFLATTDFLPAAALEAIKTRDLTSKIWNYTIRAKFL